MALPDEFMKKAAVSICLFELIFKLCVFAYTGTYNYVLNELLAQLSC